MKTVQQILDQSARKVDQGYEKFSYLYDDQLSDVRIKDLEDSIKIAMKQYAKEQCDKLTTKIGVLLVDKGHVKAALDLISNPIKLEYENIK